MAQKMYIKAIKLTKDAQSVKVVYQKGDQLYMRSATDSYKKGVPVRISLGAICSNLGFHKVESAPYFYDGQEILENIHKFSMGNKGKAVYSG